MVEGVSVDKNNGLTGTLVVVMEPDAPYVELWHFFEDKASKRRRGKTEAELEFWGGSDNLVIQPVAI